MPRTGENIYKRKDGRFEGRYITGYDENGKAKYASVYGYSKPEVREKMRQKKGETGYVSFDKGKTVREVALEWLATKKDSVASTTYRRYEEALERSIYSEYGDTPISEITEAEIEDFAKRVAEKRSQKGMVASLSTLQMSSGVLSMLVDYASGKPEKPSLMVLADKRKEFQSLDASEIERICRAAKYNETPEMLAVLLALFCGIRPGEACALHWRDVSIDGKQIYVHQSAHRVKTDDSSEYKTEMRIEEIPTKTHIRTVNVPDEIVEYMRGFYKENCCILSGEPNTPTETRTLQHRLEKVFSTYKLEDVNFQRLRKTWLEGKADSTILRDVLRGRKKDRPYEGTLDKVWLTDEMTVDLQPLRILIGLSVEDMSDILGISKGSYYQIEGGRRELSWGEYLSLLFIFHYNSKTESVVDSLGLYPAALRDKLLIQ